MSKNVQRTAKLAFKCQPCDEFNSRDRTYTRSYDLVAHLVNTHDVYPASIKHNATYLPLKSDLRPATAEEVLKYKDANKHGRKRTTGAASTGEASASGTTLETESGAGVNKERVAQKSKEEKPPTSDKGGKRDRARVTKSREDKVPREDAGREEARKAKETADEKDAAEDEADKKEYLVLQNKMEARRLAREIQNAHDTLASLRAEQEDASAKQDSVTESRVEGEKIKEGNAPSPAGASKKPRATRPPLRASVGESGTVATTEAREKAKATKVGEEKQPDKVTGQKKVGEKLVSKRSKIMTEPSHKVAMTVHSSDEDSRTEALGPALVAGALGRKLGDARTATMMRGIIECRVELLSTRQKAKLPLPPPPHNSTASNSMADGSIADDARLSLSATDLQVQVELPGDVSEMAGGTVSPRIDMEENRGASRSVEPRRVSLVSVAVPSREQAPRETGQTDEEGQSVGAIGPKLCSDAVPTAQDESSTSMLEHVVARSRTAIHEMSEAGTEQGGDEGAVDVAIGNEKRRALRDAEIAIAMREHLAATNPELVMAASLIGAVRGQPHLQTVTASAMRPSKADTPPSTVRASENIKQTTTASSAKGTEIGSGGRYRGGGDVESDSEPEATDVVVVDDTEKSGGETSGNESSSGSSSDGSSSNSGHSRVSRKRAADESPEREYIERGRQPFPGAVSRGIGGCRVHLPKRDTADCATTEEVRANREPTTTARDIPFVTVNTAVRIPAQLLAIPQTTADTNEEVRGATMEVVTEAATVRATNDQGTSTATNPTSEWGRHGAIVAEVYKVLASMEPPWGSLCVYEEMARRFPTIDPTALQMTVLAVLMTQRQCVRDMTLAGARRGPRRDENGEVFIELDLVYANRYSDSY